MISFYPGPSRVHDEVIDYVKIAHKKGILSINHRSEEFMKISERTVRLLKEKLSIPKDYTIFFNGSATECWEIIAQSLATRKSHHIYNGAFGQKWFEYTKKLVSTAKQYPFDREELPNANKLKFGGSGDVICITQNETSNGTQVASSFISEVKRNNAEHLVAVDATSSMAGVALDFHAADIWYASVQKCFGLPAGLAVMVCSPEAIERVEKINERNHYNSLAFMDDMMQKFQTPFTPNVLGIFLLMKVMEDADPVLVTEEKLKKRFRNWVEFFSERKSLQHLIHNESARSFTVIPVTAPEQTISKIKKDARKAGFLLGEGYGDLKTNTFRVANFPALKKKEISELKDFLSQY